MSYKLKYSSGCVENIENGKQKNSCDICIVNIYSQYVGFAKYNGKLIKEYSGLVVTEYSGMVISLNPNNCEPQYSEFCYNNTDCMNKVYETSRKMVGYVALSLVR